MKLAQYSQKSKKRGILTGPLRPQPLKAGVTGLKPSPLRRSDLENGVCKQRLFRYELQTGLGKSQTIILNKNCQFFDRFLNHQFLSQEKANYKLVPLT